MYKLLFFLHKTDDIDVLKYFEEHIVKNLKEVTGKNVSVAQVESNLLLDQKYSYYCEISAASKNEMDRIMNSNAGRDLNKNLEDFHTNITVIAINYNVDKK